jgi:hypothetical protein
VQPPAVEQAPPPADTRARDNVRSRERENR